MKRQEAFLLTLVAVSTLAVVALVRNPPVKPGANSGSSVNVPATVRGASLAPLVALVDYLPRVAVRDATIDYTPNVQAGIDAAAGGTLLLPDFPVRVSKRAGTTHCLLVKASISILGSAGSEFVEKDGRVQILRVENSSNVRLENFVVRGCGGQGTGLAHGILQVFGGSDIAIENVRAQDSDADGIVVADARGVRISGCRSVRASKSGIYLSRCIGGVVSNCVVEDGVGHRTAQGMLVGAGIQLSSNTDVACTGNVVRTGIGIGILCDANSTNVAPSGCTIVGNSIEGWSNDLNPDVSSGIRLQNSGPTTVTRTLVASNSVVRCGWYGIYVENHGGSTIVANTISASVRSGILVGRLDGAVVANNTIVDADQARTGGAAAIHLLNNASGVIAHGNTVLENGRLGGLVPLVIDSSNGVDNSLERRVLHLENAPVSGRWTQGDIVYSTRPQSGAPLGWVCTSGGDPGAWAAFGRIE